MSMDGRRIGRRRGLRWSVVALVALAILAIAPALLGGVSLLGALLSAACPAGTFLAGMLYFKIEEFLLVLVIVSVFGLVGPIVFRAVAGLPRAPAHPAMRLVAVALPVLLLLAVVLAFSQFCLTPDTVFYRPWAWSAPTRYAWQDVARIETACFYRGFANRDVRYGLRMKDGTGIDIMGGGDVAQAYPKLVRALSGVPFAFDASRVRTGCDFPQNIPLTTPP